MKTSYKFVIVLLAALSAHCASASCTKLPELKTVAHVDLQKYLGTWYEIASFPQRFQKGCTATTAQYSLREDGDIRVENSCRLGSPSGKLKVAHGKAWVTDETTNAKLRVQFFWPFSGKYWIIELGANYDYAVIGHPNRKYLWILSRSPSMDPLVYQGILERLTKEHLYDTKKLVQTDHGL